MSWIRASFGLAILLLMLAFGPGQALATHVRCGDTITQDTRLDSDLIDCPEDGIVIGAADITLDLNGYAIDGDGIPGNDVGINNGGFGVGSGHDGVTAFGGTVQQFEIGLYLGRDASHNVLQALNVSTGLDVPDGDGILLAGSDNRVVDVVASGNQYGIVVHGSDRNRIQRNFVSGNGEGMHVNGAQNDIERNVVSGNGTGIYLIESPPISEPPFDEAQELARGNRIEGNVLSANGAGIGITESAGNQVVRNSLSDNDTGISLHGTTVTHLVRNRVSRSAQDGIRVAGAGFIVDSPGALLKANASDRNGDDGIDVDSGEATIVRNTVNENGDLGIESVPDVIDGGGNRAFGNGNPLQCLNVVCK